MLALLDVLAILAMLTWLLEELHKISVYKNNRSLIVKRSCRVSMGATCSNTFRDAFI